MEKKKIIVIGAGITGLTVAERLSRSFGDRIIVVEKEREVGGLAATFCENGMVFDLGSHRIHENSPPSVIEYIEGVIQEDLPRRKRRGKLYFDGLLFDYPPNIFNMLRLYSRRGMWRIFAGYLLKFMNFKKQKDANYETAMIRMIGRDAYEKIYKDYARKIWGQDPRGISIEGMQRRKTLFDLKSLRLALRKSHYFYYPRRGIGYISQKLEQVILSNGGQIIKGAQLKRVLLNGAPQGLILSDPCGGEKQITASTLISTIPLDSLYNLSFHEEGKMVSLKWRDLKLLYIMIDEDPRTESETYYFPSSEMILGRVSDLKKYSGFLDTAMEKTVLTVEIPCFSGDRIWNMADGELLGLCLKDLMKCGIFPRPPKVLRYFTRNIEKAYPIYQVGWKENFWHIYRRLNKTQDLFSIGRKGLFLHCNMDHCIIQGIEAADFIMSGKAKDKEAWGKKISGFMKFSARD